MILAVYILWEIQFYQNSKVVFGWEFLKLKTCSLCSSFANSIERQKMAIIVCKGFIKNVDTIGKRLSDGQTQRMEN